jgi:MoaD family protein
LQQSPPEAQKIKITVNLTGHIHDLVGQKNITIELEERTLRRLVEKMSRMYGERLANSVLKAETQELCVLVLVNGVDVDFTGKLDTPLREGDRVDMIPPVSGG